ncbi:CMRF35-like molecule 8 [Parambassis ranga]|uniref:CMRF35-like molecule 8 n=1 Tax=Parambassis ranga TaxID=210632 RepID=A0A6P7ILI0_9TELE|nr:CMRF35-like molecule 8 [Parambassis ranga]
MRSISVFCCLLYASLTDGSKIIVEGTEGGNVSFQCSHKHAWNIPKYLCNDQCKTANDILVTVESGRRAETVRISLVDFGNGSFTVTFTQLRLSDSHTYWCGVARLGFDTYTKVLLTVKKAVANETTVIPEVFPTSHYQNLTATQVTAEPGPSPPTSVWTGGKNIYFTASNFTEGGEQSLSRGTVVYATLGGVALIFILVLVTHFRKCREVSKPHPHVCPNSTDLSNADEKEMSCVYENIDEGMQYVKKLSESTSVSIHQYGSAESSSEPLHIYENIPPSQGSRLLPAVDKNEANSVSDIYINPLPSLICESSHTEEPTMCKHTKDRAADEPPPLTGSCSDAAEIKPRTLWFGLDLSGISESSF